MISIAQTAIDEAASLLLHARRSGIRLEALPPSCVPTTLKDAHAIQDRLVAWLGEDVAGWKVSGTAADQAMRGAILASRMLPAPARISAATMPLLGIEAEIAFRFDRGLPPREDEYTLVDVGAAVTALPAIEVVDTRFVDYQDTPTLHRLCDCMSNGALVVGEPRADWRSVDLSVIPVALGYGDEILRRSAGGHPNRNPLLPTAALVNSLRATSGIKAGRIVTAGSYTGLIFVAPGRTVTATFEGFQPVTLTIEP